MAERVATHQFVIERDGKAAVVLAGARFAATDPIVKAHPTMFEPVKRATAKRRTKQP